MGIDPTDKVLQSLPAGCFCFRTRSEGHRRKLKPLSGQSLLMDCLFKVKLSLAAIEALIDKPTFEQRKTALLEERCSLENQLLDLTSENDSGLKDLNEFIELAKSACLQYRNGSDEEKRALLEKTISKRTFDEENAVFKPKYPFNLLSFCSKCPRW